MRQRRSAKRRTFRTWHCTQFWAPTFAVYEPPRRPVGLLGVLGSWPPQAGLWGQLASGGQTAR
eukprot:15467184-Alexandrium_andersonii.AAC.1